MGPHVAHGNSGNPITGIKHDAAWFAHKLYDDLAFAAPEVWLVHMIRRFEEAMGTTPPDGLQSDGHMIVHVAACEICYPSILEGEINDTNTE
jgi:hypothetical protein